MPRKKKPSILSVDTETTGLDVYEDYPYCVPLCDQDGNLTIYEWPVDPWTRVPEIPQEDIDELNDILGDPDIEKVFHHANYDLSMLQRIGVNVKPPWHDTLFMSHAICTGEASRRLNDLALVYLGTPDDDEEELLKHIRSARSLARTHGLDWNLTPRQQGDDKQEGARIKADAWMLQAMLKHKTVKPKDHPEWKTALIYYAANDVMTRTLPLYFMFNRELKKAGLYEQYQREIELFPAIRAAEKRGIRMFPQRLKRAKKRLDIRRAESAAKINSICNKLGFDPVNVQSGPQLKRLLYDNFRLPVVKRSAKTREPSTDAEALKKLRGGLANHSDKDKLIPAIETIDHLLDYRRDKTGEGFLSGYDRESRKEDGAWVLHPTFNQVGTRGTRLSSQDPNGHNVSKKADMPLRMVFGPRDGHVWYAIDYDKIELRLMAYVSQDPNLVRIIEEGLDPYLETAGFLFGPDQAKEKRPIGKIVMLAKQYTGSLPTLLKITGGNLELAREMNAKYDKAYSGVLQYTRSRANECQANGGWVNTLGGYRVWPRAAKDAANATVQGSAGDILKTSMIRIHKFLPRAWHMLLNVHDELIFEAPKPKKLKDHARILKRIVKTMEDSYWIDCYTPVSPSIIRSNWAEPRELDRHSVLTGNPRYVKVTNKG